MSSPTQAVDLAPSYEIEQLTDKNGEPRHYSIDGERVPSVTTVLRVLDKPALISWAWNLACEGGAEVIQSGLPIESQAQMREALVAREWGWWQVRDTAGLRGQRLHDALHALIEHGEVPSLAEFPEDERGYVKALATWWTETRPQVVLSELPVGSKRYSFAGRLDLVVKDWEGHSHAVLDIKSARTDPRGEVRYPYTEHHFQVGGGYRLALAETYPVFDVGDLGAATVSICENGAYRVTPAFANPGDFLYVLNAYLSLKKVEREMKDWTNR